MKSIKIITIFLSVMIFFSCQKGRERSIQKIEEIESTIKNVKELNKQGELVYNLEMACTDFATRFPDDSLAPVFLVRAFENDMRLNWYERAIGIIDHFIKAYPEHKKAPELLFHKAFIYDENLNNDSKAGETYRLFIKKYPKHPLVKDAENSIKFLGLSPEEILKELEKSNTTADTLTNKP